MRRRIVFVLLTAFVAASVGGTALHADTRRWRDAAYAHGPLDIVRIAQGHRMGPKGVPQLVHTVRFRRAWPVKKLRHQGFVHLFFDRRGHRDGPQERSTWIVYRQGRLVATMYNSLGDPPRRLARVALWRPDWRTVKVAFPKTLIKRRGLERYRWSVLAYVEHRQELCGRSAGCSDLAPNPAGGRRYVGHVL